jgi:hypothetical protein
MMTRVFPTARRGRLTGRLTVLDNVANSPQSVRLTGIGSESGEHDQ